MRDDKKKVVARVHQFIGSQEIFDALRWHVAFGEGADFKDAGAMNVVPVGTSANAVNLAFRLADSSGKPSVIMADDVIRLCDVTGPGILWKRRDGVEMTPCVLATKLRELCLRFGAKVAGVYPCANAFWQLRMAPYSFMSFIVADLFLAMPGVGVKWSDAMRPKEDVAFTCQVLVKYGLVLRANWFSVRARHHDPGGDGCGIARTRKDIAVSAVLAVRWNTPGHNVIQPGRNEAEIKLNGFALVKRIHPAKSVVLKAASDVFKMLCVKEAAQTRMMLDAVKIRLQREGECKKRVINRSTKTGARLAKRCQRGTALRGGRQMGRRPTFQLSMDSTARKALSRATRSIRALSKPARATREYRVR